MVEIGAAFPPIDSVDISSQTPSSERGAEFLGKLTRDQEQPVGSSTRLNTRRITL